MDEVLIEQALLLQHEQQMSDLKTLQLAAQSMALDDPNAIAELIGKLIAEKRRSSKRLRDILNGGIDQ